ncbi:O-antigen ligase family protein [Alcanivorax sp.]|uniref:O-antigen ligase family protein n=1 Tax=Alcanivorax sp. TaxID=1872427 RepID=UPI00261B43C4|nr:O-antigen ligase family protein [Alcanivorax sp.]
MGAQAVQTPAPRPAKALLMTTLNESRTYQFFSVWITSGLVLYLCGFFLAPSSKAQYLTLYIGIILPALYFSLWQSKRYFLSEDRALLWVLAITLALYLPSLWVTGDVLDTMRKNLKGVLFVISLAVAVRHLYIHQPVLAARIPAILFVSSLAALFLFYVVLAQQGLLSRGNIGMGNLGDNPNETGLALSVGLLILAVHLMQQPRFTALLLAIPLIMAIYLANSRSAMLGLAVTLPFAFFFERQQRKLAISYLIACAIAAGIMIALMLKGVIDAERLLSHRPSLWGEFLSHYSNFNLLWGSGLAGSITVFSEVQGVKLEPHSLYFALILRGGLLAAALYALLVILAIRKHVSSSAHSNIWGYILLFGLITQGFEGVYPVRSPNSFWLYTWLPILMLMMKTEKRTQALE